MRVEIHPDTLRALLRYDPIAGILYWRERAAALFADTLSRSRRPH